MAVKKRIKNFFSKISKKNTLRESKENLTPKESFIKTKTKNIWSKISKKNNSRESKENLKTKKTKNRRFRFFLRARQGYDNLASLGSNDSISLTSSHSLQQEAEVRNVSNQTAANIDNDMVVDVIAEIHSNVDCTHSPFQQDEENNNNTRDLMHFDELDEPEQIIGATKIETPDVGDNQPSRIPRETNIMTQTTNDSSKENTESVDADAKEENNENTPTASVSMETLYRRQQPDSLAENTDESRDTIDVVQELPQTNELMKIKLEEKDENFKLLESKYEEVVSEMAEREIENKYLKQSLLGTERNVKRLQDEMETFMFKMMKQQSEMEKFAVVQQDKIDKLLKDVKRLKESSQQAVPPMVLHKPKNCQVNLGKKGVMNTRNGSSGSSPDSSPDSSSSSSPEPSSHSEHETASPACLSSPDLSTDEHDTDLPFGLEECSQDETYKKEVYPSEIAWNELQNLDFPEATDLPLETIDEDDEQTCRKDIYVDDEQTYRKELYQDTDVYDEQTFRKEVNQGTEIVIDEQSCLTKKMGIGQLHEGFMALHYFLESHTFSPYAEQPEKYMKIVDFIMSLFGVDLYRFFNLIGVPMSDIPEEFRQGGDRAVVSYALYTWCCLQSGPNATGSSLAVAMSAKLSNMVKRKL